MSGLRESNRTPPPALDLFCKEAQALQNDDKAEQIARAGTRRAQEVFDYQSVLIYLHRLLHAYAELFVD